MSLILVSDVQARIPTDLSDTIVQGIIDQEESELIRRFGAHGDGVTAESRDYYPQSGTIWLRRPLSSITSATEYVTLDSTSGTVLAATSYRLVAGQGALIRFPHGTAWGPRVTVVGVPVDDRPLRRAVLLDLVRLTIERTAMRQESVASEYSYTAPAWDAERQGILRRMKLGYEL